MPVKKLLFAVPVIAFLAAACGDGADTPETPTPEVTVAATPTPDSVLPTPNPASESDVVLTVAKGKTSFTATFAEFKALPQAEIAADGTKQGVALATLAEKVGAGADTVVTIEGRTQDLTRTSLYRAKVSDLVSKAVFTIDAEGRVGFVASSVPKEQWLAVVIGVSFQ